MPQSSWGVRELARQQQRYERLVEVVLEEGEVFDEKVRKTGMVSA